jgi:hypothetical protein
MDNVDNFFPESITNTEFDGIVEDCFTSNEAPTCFLEDEDSLNKTPAKSDSSSGEGKKYGSSQSNGSIGICVCTLFLLLWIAYVYCLTLSLENYNFQVPSSKSTKGSICKLKVRKLTQDCWRLSISRKPKKERILALQS